MECCGENLRNFGGVQAGIRGASQHDASSIESDAVEKRFAQDLCLLDLIFRKAFLELLADGNVAFLHVRSNPIPLTVDGRSKDRWLTLGTYRHGVTDDAVDSLKCHLRHQTPQISCSALDRVLSWFGYHLWYHKERIGVYDDDLGEACERSMTGCPKALASPYPNPMTK